MECARHGISLHPLRCVKRPTKSTSLESKAAAEPPAFGWPKQKAVGPAISLPSLAMKCVLMADKPIEKVEGSEEHTYEGHKDNC